MTEKTEDLIAEMREYATTLRAGDLPVGAALIERAADRLAALTTPQEDKWCREETCVHRHWRSGSMPTHRRGESCPKPFGNTEQLPTPQEGGARAVLERIIEPYIDTAIGDYGSGSYDETLPDAILAAFPVLSRAAAPEPEWEYATTQWGSDRQPHGRLTRGEITPEQWFAELGDREDLELVRRRKAGPWLPVGGGDE